MGLRQLPARHQTLRAIYDWTYGLLDEPEQRLFRRLGAMSAPLELAEVVALTRLPGDDDEGDDWQRHDLLATLVERSLLQMDDADPPRYRLLESARAYAMARLLEAGEHAALGHASAWYEEAGDRAAQAASGTQALVHFGTALELLRQQPASASRDERELQLCLKLGPAIQATLGPAHARCEAVYRRSVELARAAPPGPAAFQALWGYWQFLTLAGRDREAAPFAREIVEMAPALDDDGLQLEALHAEMTSADLLGDAPAVVAHAERIGAMYDRCRHHRLSFAFGGHDPGVCALGQGSLNHWLCGRPERAAAMARQALDLAASLDHGYSRATGAFYAAITFAALGDDAALARTAESLVRLSDDYGMEMLLTEGRFFQGRARFVQGDAEAGLAQMGEALQAIEASRDLGFVFVYMALLGDALLQCGQAGEVVALVERALGHAALGQGLFHMAGRCARGAAAGARPGRAGTGGAGRRLPARRPPDPGRQSSMLITRRISSVLKPSAMGVRTPGSGTTS
jgi:predicted ATPase